MEEIGFATIREFQRLAQEFPQLLPRNEDLKSFQRPWCVDRLLKHLPQGGRVLEIGADKCDLVPFLRSRGFDVWVVDVYDHFGGGTGTYDIVHNKFPDMPIVRTFLHEDRSLPANHFDAVYSCSVIEHVPLEHLAATVHQIERVLQPGGASIHAIDCTIQGVKQNQINSQSFIDAHHRTCDVQELGRRAIDDLETFYLSPQAHLNWRRFNQYLYDQYPYRRVTSLGFAASKNHESF